VVSCAKESVKPADVIDVKMGEEEMVDGLDLRASERVNASLATIKEKTKCGLSCVQANEERVVLAGASQHVIFNAHCAVTT
jgi:hypothetical protein